jgi:hypothetical protein
MQVAGGDGIDVAKANGVVTISLDLAQFADLPSIPAELQDVSNLIITQEIDGVSSQYTMTVANFMTQFATYQPLDATLTALAGVTTAADKLIYATGSDAFATTDLTAAGRAIMDDANAAAQRTTLGLAIGTDVAAQSHVGSGGTAHADAVAAGAAGFMTGADKTKLDGVASGATANSADATLLARANHTGTQASSTITATATNDDAAAGYVGEHKETTVALGSAVALADVTPKSFGTLSLEAGDWDVWVEAQFTSASATGVTQFLASLSTTADTLDSTRLYTFNLPSLSMGTGGQSLTYMGRVPLAGTTTMQGVVRAAFTGGGLSAYGKIRARRAR